jgi:hypothetical protein
LQLQSKIKSSDEAVCTVESGSTGNETGGCPADPILDKAIAVINPRGFFQVLLFFLPG